MDETIAVGIACNKWQIPAFWKALLDVQQYISYLMASGGALTDQNRNAITDWFLDNTTADWLFFIDDDVEIPNGALPKLLKAAKDHDALFVAGIYYRRKPPCDPLIYRRLESGWYASLLPKHDYEYGDVIEIDAAGMGCTLIHRKAFEAILDNHFLFRRHTGSYGFMHYDNVQEGGEAGRAAGVYIADGKAQVVQDIIPFKPDQLGPKETLPFFAFEYGRTEDFHFCELLNASGIKMFAHTGIECNHWGEAPINRAQYEQVITWMQRTVQEGAGAS